MYPGNNRSICTFRLWACYSAPIPFELQRLHRWKSGKTAAGSGARNLLQCAPRLLFNSLGSIQSQAAPSCFLSGNSRRNFMDWQYAGAGPVTTCGEPVPPCEYFLKNRDSDIQFLFPNKKACQILFQVASFPHQGPLPQVLTQSVPSSVHTGVV